MNILHMTKKDFKDIPMAPKDLEEFDCLVIIPTKKEHDGSGFMDMKFVAVDENFEPIGYLHPYDIITINNLIDNKIKSWRIDCLPCGYLRLFSCGNPITRDELGLYFC